MGTFTNDVELTILDGGGVVTVPGANVQLVIGCAAAGTIGQVVATRNPNTLVNIFQAGPLVEAAAMAIKAGAIVLAMRCTANTAGALSAVVFSGTGTSVITVTGTPYDTSYFKVLFDVGGTIGTAGIKFRVSQDGGRSYGPQYALGAAVTFPIPGTGVTLAFSDSGTATIVAGDSAKFLATEPLPNTAGVQACLTAVQATAYGNAGWGSAHILGKWAGTDATAIQGMLNAMKAAKIYTRAIINADDASPPSAYSGTGETEAAWMARIMTSFSAVQADRVNVCAGHYNMPGAIQVAGVLPLYRRPLSWAVAARTASGIPPQRHQGRVRDGNLTQIAVDPANDQSDGFVYHDERQNPGLDDARFTTAMSRTKKTGYWVKNPRLMAQIGSTFWLHPRGSVMDVACDILSDIGQDDIADDVRLKPAGQLYENDALALESRLKNALDTNMTNANMISSCTVAANRDWNVKDTSKVKVAATLIGRGYILEEDIEIGFA